MTALSKSLVASVAAIAVSVGTGLPAHADAQGDGSYTGEELAATLDAAPAIDDAAGDTTSDYASAWEGNGASVTVPWDADGTLESSLRSPEDGIDIDISFTLPDAARDVPTIVTSDDTVVHESDEAGFAVANRIEGDGSLATHAIAYSSDGPAEFTYDFDDDLVIDVQRTGAAAILQDGVLVGLIEHASAVDADGNAVASWYTTSEDGSSLTQHVDADEDAEYPVVSTMAVGTFWTKGDYVHVTGGQASGHGWWIRGTTKATQAKVTVQLQAYSTTYLGWHNVGSKGSAIVAPGGGAGRRANARFTCLGSLKTFWGSTVDADIIGYLDSPEKAIVRNPSTINCSAPN
ncbi:MAG: hypothetical protein LKI27_09020 [Actinomyces sp.]|jgi:hypothetical protein|nr:hypothetical protein [Actinomyces sp.]MCI1663016.1 hypothetical protein [Actinomyces sp.]